MRWQIIKQEWIDPSARTPTKILGQERTPRKCKFCGQLTDRVTFKKQAHVIPASLGNRSLLSAQECDFCNEHLGSRLEDDLLKFLSVPRAMARIRARGGTRKHRIGAYKSYLQADVNANKVNAYAPEDEDIINSKDDGTGTLHLDVRVLPFRPLNVAKALGRIALFLMDESEPGFEPILSWVKGEQNWCPVPLLRLVIPGAGFNLVGAVVNRLEDYPHAAIYRVFLMYSMFILTLPLRGTAREIPQNLPLLDLPAPWTFSLLQNTSLVHIHDDEPIREGVESFSCTYKSRTVVSKA